MGEAGPAQGHSRTSTATMYSRRSFASNSTSPPAPTFRSDIFGKPPSAGPPGQFYGAPQNADRNGAAPISDAMFFAHRDARPAPAVLIRKLPRNIGQEAIKSMLLFAGDLIDTEFIRSPYPEDRDFATAVARFQTGEGAMEAQQKLNNKPNMTKDALMIVEAHNTGVLGSFERRNTIDGAASRTQTSSSSSGRSRFNSTFHSNTERVSPPLLTPNSGLNGEFPTPENSAHFQNLFSPQSPLANGMDGTARISGKSMINDDKNVDDETGELLKDPIAYAKNGHQAGSRRATNPGVPVGRFGSLSLSTQSSLHNGMDTPTPGNYQTSRGNGSISTGPSPLPSANGAYAQNYPRAQYPPVNPADQNPPCNTLYVGNLPIDTSEDELKQLFCKQRGYKRLCFRTKQNGPMCFVEFEDVSFATKALHELYGHLLHNSVKGGIRLSFSKNPLGVRSNQSNGMAPNTVMSPQAMAPGYGSAINSGNFSAVSGPPPGLGSPPGLANNYRTIQTGMDGMFANPFGMGNPDFGSQLSPRNYSGGVPQPLGSGTFGRESHGYTDYALGR